MVSWDGAELFYRAWIPAEPTEKALLLFHRGHEHSGRWSEVVEMLDLPDVAIFAWDARGHGRSPGERGAAENFGAMVKDVDAFVRHVAERHGFALENIIVLAHSVGAVSVAAWVHDYAPPIRAMILATPAFRVRLYVPLAIPSLRLKQKFLGPGFVKSYVKAKMLTHDPVQAARYDGRSADFSPDRGQRPDRPPRRRHALAGRCGRDQCADAHALGAGGIGSSAWRRNANFLTASRRR